MHTELQRIHSRLLGHDIDVGFDGKHIRVAARAAPCTHPKGMHAAASSSSSPSSHGKDAVVRDVVKRLGTSVARKIVMILP